MKWKEFFVQIPYKHSDVSCTPLHVLVFGVLFLIGGLILFLAVGFPRLSKALESSQWEISNAEILKSETHLFPGIGPVSHLKKTHTAVVEYKFSVAGKSYIGSEIVVGGLSPTSEKSHAILLAAKYPLGSKQRIYFDPEDPSRSVIKPGVHSQHIWVSGFSFLFVFIGLAAIFGSMWIVAYNARSPGTRGKKFKSKY